MALTRSRQEEDPARQSTLVIIPSEGGLVDGLNLIAQVPHSEPRYREVSSTADLAVTSVIAIAGLEFRGLPSVDDS